MHQPSSIHYHSFSLHVARVAQFMRTRNATRLVCGAIPASCYVPPHAAACNRTEFQIVSLHFNQMHSFHNKDITRNSSSEPSKDNKLRVSLDGGWHRACRHAIRNFKNVRPADATRGGPGGWRRPRTIIGAAALRTFVRPKSLGCSSKDSV